jgi:hypothetical protein
VQNDSTKKRLSPTVSYLLTGLVFACPTLFAVGWLIPEIAQQSIITPGSLAIIHALVLGFMLTVAFGVLYQVVPIAFQAPPMPRHVFYWHLPIHICSVLLMIYGFLNYRMPFVATGGLLLCIGAISYLYILQAHYRKARNKTFVHRGLSFPIVSLVIVILIGLWQASFPQTVSLQLVLTHAIIGGLAFWGGLVLVVSYKFIPMFALSHGYQASLPRAKWLYFSGLFVLIFGEWMLPVESALYFIGKLAVVLGCILGAAGILSFVIDVWNILRARKRKRMVNPVREAMIALSFIVCGQIFLFIAIPLQSVWLTIFAAYLFAFGGLVPLIMAYMQKIVPFLWFEYRFSKRPERKAAPLLDDMVPKQLSKIAVILYFCGMCIGFFVLLVTSLLHLASINTLIRLLPGSIMAISIILLFISLRHVLTIGGPRPED